MRALWHAALVFARLLTLPLLALSCAAPSGLTPEAPRAAPSGWSRYRDPGGRFELSLPPDAALADHSPSATSRYFTWSPKGARSTFSVLVDDHPGDSIEPLLEDAKVVVELDEELGWQGRTARHVRARSEHDQPRSWGEDPNGRRWETGPRHVREVIDFMGFSGPNASLRVGFRLDVEDAARYERTFVQMVESFSPAAEL